MAYGLVKKMITQGSHHNVECQGRRLGLIGETSRDRVGPFTEALIVRTLTVSRVHGKMAERDTYWAFLGIAR
ncbi:MAG: hypothetical protein D6704_02845 [Nitrospirae bacterium]|nr:MAG: hypothetical protein D6704_02845 [Nitrospirota bacterium]